MSEVGSDAAAARPAAEPPPGWLALDEYRAIYARVPRLCVEVVLVDAGRGVLLSLRDIPPNVGAWHIPGGTVLFGETLEDAVRRVARGELELEVTPGDLLGTIEYPSHYERGIDHPVGLAYACSVAGPPPDRDALKDGLAWFTRLPRGLYEEQRSFLAHAFGFESE